MSLTSYRAAPPRVKERKVAAAARIFPFVRPQKRRSAFVELDGVLLPRVTIGLTGLCGLRRLCKCELTLFDRQKQKAACAALKFCLL